MMINMDNSEPTLDEITALTDATLLEFGAEWCGYCQAAQATIAAALINFPHVRHIKIEDGKGRRLGRMFHVKRWPTLVLIKNGLEITRLVREIAADDLREALLRIE